MFTLASCTVKNATTMPVALATLATLTGRSRPHRITKVRPTAMIAGDRDLRQDVREVAQVAKDGLARVKNSDQEEQRHEGRDVAQLVAQPVPRRVAGRPADVGGRGIHAGVPQAAASSRSLLIGSSANSRTISPFLITRMRSASESTVSGSVETTMIADPLLAQAAHDAHDVLLGADVHAARRLAQHQHARQVGQPSGQRDLLLVAARQRAERRVRPSGGADAQGLDVAAGDRALRRRAAARAGRCGSRMAIETFL